MGLEVKIGSLGAEDEYFKLGNQKCFFFLHACSQVAIDKGTV